VVDNVTARCAAATVTKPLPGGGTENNAGRVMDTTVGAGMWRQVLAIKLIIFVVLKRQLANCTCRRLYHSVQPVC